ncbi:MAG TPA: dihydrolipoamide acetyltransferase family protein [Gemmataceae bacterium]|nr:dihydrolipoamide acetyltransferase family protein [Gemmataceae bacterium]
MAIPITIPRLGWNMEQGVFGGWLKANGTTIRAGEPLFTLESEKATEDIEGFDDGVLHIPADGPRQGDVVAVGAVIGFLLQPGEPIGVGPASRAGPGAPNAPRTPPVRLGSPDLLDAPRRDRPTSSPRARRTAANLGIDWRNAKGTGQTGRIRERDVLALAAIAPDTQSATGISSTRRVIAERMLTSHRSTAPVTLMTMIDATNLVNLRNRWKAAPQSSGDLVPTYTDLFVKLAAMALERHPGLNARWENDRIVSPKGIHIGIAVDTDAGLLVPVVRDVPRLSVQELSLRSRDLIDRARQRRLSTSELQGGTFTVTSLGHLGIDAFTPIINYPECAILGIGRIRRCPVVYEDQIVIRDQVTLSLTFDHRITDGAPAARFLQTLTGAIEELRGIS